MYMYTRSNKYWEFWSIFKRDGDRVLNFLGHSLVHVCSKYFFAWFTGTYLYRLDFFLCISKNSKLFLMCMCSTSMLCVIRELKLGVMYWLYNWIMATKCQRFVALSEMWLYPSKQMPDKLQDFWSFIYNANQPML